jgi:phosphoribosylanthranilate isomerase
MVVRVKICGLTRKEDIDYAVECGADALGFVFGYKESPRNLSFKDLRNLIMGVPPYVSTVVVARAYNSKLLDVIHDLKPSFIQLYEDDDNNNNSNSVINITKSFPNIIRVVHPSIGGGSFEEFAALSKTSKGILIDSKTEKAVGGTGITHDWTLSRKIRDALYPFPVILAGGLTSMNVKRAIEEVQPYAVDVSSGVELRPGVKDRKKVKEFIENAKKAGA